MGISVYFGNISAKTDFSWNQIPDLQTNERESELLCWTRRLHMTFSNMKKNYRSEYTHKTLTHNQQQHAHPAKIIFHFVSHKGTKYDIYRMLLFVCTSIWSSLSAGDCLVGCFVAWLKTRPLTSDLQGVQQAVDAADQIVPLAWQGFIRVDVGIFLHLAGHQPLGLLAGTAHQFLQLAV